MACNCGYCPTIVVPGIGQSKSFEVDENGNRIKSAWPISFDTESVKKKLIFPALRMMILRHDCGFTKALGREIGNALETVSCNHDGTPKRNIKVVSYEYPLSECTSDEKRFIYKMVPIQRISDVIGENHTFYFSYNIFGQLTKTVEELDKFVEMVKQKTGHDKVNILNASMGGSITTFYLSRYGHKGDVNRVVGIVPAYDGSVLISDVLRKNINFDDYTNFFKILLGNKTGENIGKLVSMIPKKIVKKAVDTMLDSALETAVLNSETMWGVVPAEDYDDLRERFLSDDSHKKLREIADEACKIKKDFKSFLSRFPDISFYTLCGYDLSMSDALKSTEISTDTVIHTYSCSMGATVADVGKTLSDDYVQKEHNERNFISPDRKIDASCGALPYTTWYFKNMDHEASAKNDILLDVAKRILTDEAVKSIDDTPECPQFSVYKA